MYSGQPEIITKQRKSRFSADVLTGSMPLLTHLLLLIVHRQNPLPATQKEEQERDVAEGDWWWSQQQQKK